MSFYNGDKWNACGLIPMIGYIPSSINAPSCDCVIINGGNDFNRYTSANARKRIGDRAVHRFHEKGHAAAPDWMMHDSMAWLEGRYLAQNPKDNEQEMSTYFYSMLDWIEVLRKSNPHRAYYWALFLESEFKLNYLQRMKLDPIIEELGADEKNRLYVEGLNELDQLSLSELAGVTDGSKMDYTDSSLAAVCQPLMIKYAGTPYIPEVLEALCRETGNLNPKKRK
jgi:hypothetical protein